MIAVGSADRFEIVNLAWVRRAEVVGRRGQRDQRLVLTFRVGCFDVPGAQVSALLAEIEANPHFIEVEDGDYINLALVESIISSKTPGSLVIDWVGAGRGDEPLVLDGTRSRTLQRHLAAGRNPRVRTDSRKEAASA